MNARVLFVDDEPKILDGLKRMLRSVRRDWDMAFAEGGQMALAAMAEQPADVIVSDMRMPGMDGGQLLNEIQDRYPAAIRLVLSGQCDADTMFRLVGNSHQFLSKPCDADRLIGTVKRALGLRDLLARDDIRTLVSGLCSVPCPSAVWADLAAALKAPEPSLDKVADIMARDPALALKILQLSNSSYFGIGAAVHSPEQAVRVLGVDTIKALVLTHDVVPQVEDNAAYDRVCRHSGITAKIARALAQAEGLPADAVENASVGGLLHDIGALLLAARHPDEYRDVITATAQETSERLELERNTFGATHAEVGAYLAGLWGLPDSVVEAIAFHHAPRDAGQDSVGVLTTVHLAEGLTQVAQYGAELDQALDREYLGALGIDEGLEGLRALACEIFEEESRA